MRRVGSAASSASRWGSESQDVERAEDSIEVLKQRFADTQREAEGEVANLERSLDASTISLRQVEDLLGVLLPRDQATDHSTLGRWVADEAERAGAILAALDPACVGRVEILAIDEIFFGGGRPWSGSSPRP